MRAILIVGFVVLLLYFLSKAAAPLAAAPAPAPAPAPHGGCLHVPGINGCGGYGRNPNFDDRQPDAFGYGYAVPDVVGRGDDINSVTVRSFR